MPPALIRRPLTITVWLLSAILSLALSPVLLAVGTLYAAACGDRRLMLMTRVFVSYFARGLVTLAACGLLWIRAGLGTRIHAERVQALHWRLLRWFVRGIAGAAQEALSIDVTEQPESAPADSALRDPRPLIVLSRHAGPGDTILILDRLLSHFGRRPSVVMKETVALEPTIDLLTHRLPHAVLDAGDSEGCERQITETAAAVGPRGVLLIFPEGGNFTPERRRRALASLWRDGWLRAARAGERMQHVMPPRPAGTIAALRGCPAADVVFAAHTGLGLAAYPLAIWHDLPIGRTLTTRLWLVSREDVPEGEKAITEWLTDWWQRIDAWVDAQGQES